MSTGFASVSTCATVCVCQIFPSGEVEVTSDSLSPEEAETVAEGLSDALEPYNHDITDSFRMVLVGTNFEACCFESEIDPDVYRDGLTRAFSAGDHGGKLATPALCTREIDGRSSRVIFWKTERFPNDELSFLLVVDIPTISRTRCFELDETKFDRLDEIVALLGAMPDKDVGHRRKGIDAEIQIRALLSRASVGDPKLTSDDWKLIGKHATKTSKERALAEAIATVDRLAHELFPELKPEHRATADRLTKLFAKRAKSELETIDDATKLKFVELTRAWKAAGGSIEYEEQAVRLDTSQTSSPLHDRAFRILEARKGNHPLKQTISLPEISFRK